ncbi:MAG: hypothetical protein JXR40_09280, partial [Pontiellaceae bacterium]|nr:hypothetical protein [Pontiellaceae bacterium]
MHKRIFVLGFVLGVLGARAGLAATVVLSNTNIVGTVNAGVTAQYTIDNRLSSNYYITNSVIIAANGQELFVSPFFSDDVNAS